MHPKAPRESDDLEPTDDLVMTGDGAEPRVGPKPTMTADGAVIDPDEPEDRVMTGDGAERRDGPRPEMTADGVKSAGSDDDDEKRDR
jgi:hypothetical protein